MVVDRVPELAVILVVEQHDEPPEAHWTVDVRRSGLITLSEQNPRTVASLIASVLGRWFRHAARELKENRSRLVDEQAGAEPVCIPPL